MTFSTLFIHWLVDPEIGVFLGRAIRWYGLFFGCGFLIGYSLIYFFFKREGKHVEHIDTLALYMAAGVFIGSRLGHCLFYEPEFYLSHPLEILKIWRGGLSSHGGAIGVIFSLYIFSKYVLKDNVLWILDRIVLVVALGGGFIRMGNLMNSEIVGKETSMPWGFVFQHEAGPDQYGPNFYTEAIDEGIKVYYKPKSGRNISNFQLYVNEDAVSEKVIWEESDRDKGLYETVYETPNYGSTLFAVQDRITQEISSQIRFVPRHPSQLYEALFHFSLFIALFIINFKMRGKWHPGRLFGLYLVVIFVSRLFIELFKKEQVNFEVGMALNMGQILSIPLIMIGLYFLFRKKVIILSKES